MKSIQYDINKQDFMTLRPFNINDAPTILSWCKDKHAFRLWSADRYKDYPAKPKEMMEQYNSNNMYPLTAVVDNLIIGHILLRYPSEDKTVIRFGFVIVDDSKRGKGYGKQMLRLAIDHAKHKLGVQKITLGVFDNNPSEPLGHSLLRVGRIRCDWYRHLCDRWRRMDWKRNGISYKKQFIQMKEILYILTTCCWNKKE